MDFPIAIPFVQAMGFELLRMQGGEAELGLQLRADQHNSMHMAHGGVTMTLLDVTMAHAARSADVAAAAPAGATGRAVITVEMKTSFIRPGAGRLTIRAECVHKATSLMFCEGEARDEQGRLVAPEACVTYTFAVVGIDGDAGIEPTTAYMRIWLDGALIAEETAVMDVSEVWTVGRLTDTTWVSDGNVGSELHTGP
jgi:uncharacterized protein (TIGR00369 family)